MSQAWLDHRVKEAVLVVYLSFIFQLALPLHQERFGLELYEALGYQQRNAMKRRQIKQCKQALYVVPPFFKVTRRLDSKAHKIHCKRENTHTHKDTHSARSNALLMCRNKNHACCIRAVKMQRDLIAAQALSNIVSLCSCHKSIPQI